jgi:hypothetical protein
MTRVAWFAFVLTTLLCAQKTGEVGWDPKFDRVTPVWQEFLGLAVVALAAYAYWRLARWFIDRRRDRPQWKILRYWWPSLMLALAGMALITGYVPMNSLGESLYEMLVLLALFLNLPTVPAVLLDGLIIDVSGWRGWSIFLLIIPSLWAAWYGIIRFLEWRSDCGAPLSLRSSK